MSRAVELERVGKRYRLGERTEGYETIRDSLSAAFRRLGGDNSALERELWALNDVSFAVDEGETVGIVGRNGAGKTTLLKIVARITEPTRGVSRTRGRVGALLDVGTGFHPELTGRENVYLNGAVLGMSRAAIRHRFDEIVAFADLERFLDTPLKRYSSGMYLRLAFAVAAHLEPDIVVVDEVLAVGDAEFQKKCLSKMSSFGREGRTVLFVSHDLGAVNRLCPRAVWLDRGSVLADGATSEVVNEYLRSVPVRRHRANFTVDPGNPVQPLSLAAADESGTELDHVVRGEPLFVRLRFIARRRVAGFDIALSLANAHGTRVLHEVWSDTRGGVGVSIEPGEYDVLVAIPPILRPGDYVVGLWIGTHYETFIEDDVMSVRVAPRPDDREEWTERARVVQPPVRWTIRGDRPDVVTPSSVGET
jgi:ABC-type polysaccharide/polyol phosphate transport system ATPase subunit